MKRLMFALLGLLWIGPAFADRIYSDGFEVPVITPLFPAVGNTFQLPPGPATNQLAWLIGELASGETTSISEINAHFSANWLSQTSAEDTQIFINNIRASFPDAVVTDVIGVTPVRLTLLIDTPGSGSPSGFLQFGADYAGDRKIELFGVSNFNGTVQYPDDQNLSLIAAADKFTTLSSAPGLLVARIRPDGHCESVVDRNAAQLHATASMFKIWVLGGVARAIASGTIAPEDPVALVASELAPGGTINSEPLGTLFPVSDLANLMMGISDNTATDLLHELVGREEIGEAINAYGVAQPEILTPLLGISEQFHLFFSFPLDVAEDYVNGTEAYQQDFLVNEIEPLGPSNGGPYFNTPLLTDGSWRATPLDICAAFSHLRRLPQGSDAIDVADHALGAQAAQPNVRNAWDRVWYKGGSLAANDGYHVLTHGWMLENNGEDPWVLVAMSNDANGGIDEYKVQSVTGRILQLLAEMP